MATLITELYFRALLLFICALVSSFGQNLLSCDTTSPDASGYRCTGAAGSQDHCGTFAILRTNSYYSSLFNLSFYLGLNQFVISEANGFSADTEFLPKDQPLLIPIDCKCNAGFFQADLTKITIKGESFVGIAESLEGLTTCKAIQEKNPGISPWGLADKARLQVPLRCACPSSSENIPQTRLFLSYPISEGDTVSSLASKFNTTAEAIVSANKNSLGSFKPESLTLFTSLLIPLNGEPGLGPLAKPREPNLRDPETNSNIPDITPPKKKSKMLKMGAYIALSGVVVGGCIAIAAAVVVILLKKKKRQNPVVKERDVELQQLSASVRTTSDKKVSFEGSQSTIEGQIIDNAPQRMLLESYSIEDLRRATEDFNSSNHIEGSVYHGRLSGKNLAIKRAQPETISKIDMQLFRNATHHHPNIIRLLGKCLTDGPHSFLVFEYAKNGSLKDWLHGGLAMKNQFIASCYCFLTWSQRLRICLDVAMALQYMHQVMNPSYVHRNIKSRNIFLDEEFNAKVGNFGMARCVEDDTESPQFYSANPASWSLGYLAPEYIHERIIAPSIDIFAFGVVLLEVLSGQTPINRPKKKDEGSVWLSEKIKSILQSENADELREWIDSALGENYSFDDAVTVANLARACVEEDPAMRPSAGEIVEKLSRLIEELPQAEHISICESSSKPLVKASATK
ncbi:LysM receptor kinase [Melia azedarach]|uniref:LysM receptor kinase n=1 Tax=Melia azedarach TaxID=155640 RepID=A0ACC1Z1W0_MELAZ|nr:LysM receptor kinase [Melia azedarach]